MDLLKELKKYINQDGTAEGKEYRRKLIVDELGLINFIVNTNRHILGLDDEEGSK